MITESVFKRNEKDTDKINKEVCKEAKQEI